MAGGRFLLSKKFSRAKLETAKASRTLVYFTLFKPCPWAANSGLPAYAFASAGLGQGKVTNLKMKYELVYILSPKLTEEEAQKAVADLKAKITEKGAAVIREDFWGKRKLAYQIRHLDHGYYVLTVFEAAGESLAAINRVLQVEKLILRSLIVIYQEGAEKRPETPEVIEAKKKTAAALKEKAPLKEEAVKAAPVKIDKEEEILTLPEEKKTPEKPEKKAETKKEEKVDVEALDKKLDQILGKL